MLDPRFHEQLGPVRLGDLAVLAEAEGVLPEHADIMIMGVAPLDRAGPGDVTFLSDRKFLAALGATKAAACFVHVNQAKDVPPGVVVLATRFPQFAYAKAAERLFAPRGFPAGDPAIHPSAQIEDGAIISPNVTIGAGASIGRGTRVSPGVVIGPGVAIGRDGYIGAGAVILNSLVGDGAKILSNAVLGEAGFGAAGGPRGVVDLPQLGRVIIQDNVTIGAGTCIDRGAYEDTVIGENTKIDNLVQIGHNNVIGRNCVIAAQVGMSGSCKIGDGVAMGGQVGLADHRIIGDGAQLAGKSGIMQDVAPGERVFGVPAKPIRQALREQLVLKRLVEGSGGAKNES